MRLLCIKRTDTGALLSAERDPKGGFSWTTNPDEAWGAKDLVVWVAVALAFTDAGYPVEAAHVTVDFSIGTVH